MRLYHPDAITDDLLDRLDPPVDDSDIAVFVDLPVTFTGQVVANGGEVALTGRMAARDDGVELIGFDKITALHRPDMTQMQSLRERGSLRMPDLSFPEFYAEQVKAVAKLSTAFLGVDTVVGDSVGVAALRTAYLSIPAFAAQVPVDLVAPDGWFDLDIDQVLVEEAVVDEGFMLGDRDQFPGRHMASFTELDEEDDLDEPVVNAALEEPEAKPDAGLSEAIHQAQVRAQRTGQVGDLTEDDTPEARRKPVLNFGDAEQVPAVPAAPEPIVPLRPSRAPEVSPGVGHGPSLGAAK